MPNTLPVDSMFDLSGKVVLITGANGQLGKQYISAFLQRGAMVAGLDLPCSQDGGADQKYPKENYLFCGADITNKDELLKSLKKIKSKFGRLDVLVNNAALDSPPGSPANENGPFEDYPEQSWDKVLDVNLKGTYLCCQVFGGEMAERGGGAIINIASIYGMVAPDQRLYDYRRKNGEIFYKPIAYAASKSGVLNLTRYLAVYWAPKKIRVNSLSIAGVFNHQDKEFLNAYCGRIPIGRMANEDEYCGAVLFLASDAAGYMTGSNMVVDGGWTAI